MGAFAELKAFLGLDTSKFQAGIKDAEGKTAKFSKTISGIGGMLAGAFSAGAIIAFGRSLMNVAYNMKNMAEATNSTMGAMVALKTIGAENNINWDEMSKILGKVRDAQGAVVNLSKAQSDALEKLNINADEFVGAGTDKALELIANAYVKANGSAEAFSAVNDLFGAKIGPRAIEMLKALAAEGIGPLSKRTKEATKGFEELAAAQSTIEKFFSSVQIWAAKAIGAISSFGEELGKLSVQSPKQGVLSSVFEAIGSVFYKGKFDQDLGVAGGAPKGGVSGTAGGEKAQTADTNPDVEKRRKNLAEVAAKKAEEENKRAQELGRRYYFKELHNADQQKQLESDYAEAVSKVKATGKGINADSIARIGGSIGGSRPVLAPEDRTIKIQTEQLQVQKDFTRKLQELIDKQERDRDRDEG